MEELSLYKSKLFEALGNNSKKYLELLKMWFKLNLTKLEFDTEARKLLDKSAITYHNKFLVSLFTRCQLLSSSSSITVDSINNEEPKRKKQKVKLKSKEALKTVLENRLLPLSYQNANFNQLNKSNLQILNRDKKILFCTTEATLPDYFMSNLRLFVNVWEFGVDGITDDAINLTNLAIRDFIKKILISVLTFKSEFRTCENNKFKYGFGTGSTNPFLINSSTFNLNSSKKSDVTVINENGDLEPKFPYNSDLAIQNALLQIACSTNYKKYQKINLWHLYYALKNDPNCIPTHSVREINIERIQMKLYDNESL